MNKLLLPSLLLFFAGKSFAQPTTSEFSNPTGKYQVVANNIVNDATTDHSNIASTGLSDFMNIDFTAGVGGATYTIDVDLNASTTSGTYAGFYIQSANTAEVSASVTVKTFDGATEKETILNNTPLINVLSSGSGYLYGQTTAGYNYNKVQVTFSLLANAIFKTHIHYGFGGYTSVGLNSTNGTTSEFSDPSGQYQVSTTNIVQDNTTGQSNIASDGTSDYMNVDFLAGAPAATYTIDANLSSQIASGTYAGFYMMSSDLLSVSGNVTVKTFEGAVEKETIINNTPLLNVLSDGTGYVYGQTTAGYNYDKVEITFSPTANALFKTHVHYAFGGYSSYASVTLPVKIEDLKYAYKNEGREVYWSGQTEGKTSYEIQRSKDGINFTTIGKIISDNNNNGNEHFTFYDPQLPGTDVFYRIRATEENNTASYYSKTIAASAKSNPGIKTAAIFPNPVTNRNFSIQLPVGSKPTGLVELINMKGQSVYEFRPPSANNNLIQVQLKNTLSPGMYIVRIQSDSPSGVISGKILIK